MEIRGYKWLIHAYNILELDNEMGFNGLKWV